MTDIELTKKEQRAIERFKKAAEALPETLWIWVADNNLYVMKKNCQGQRAVVAVRVAEVPDPDYIAASVEVEADGGEW